MEDKVNGGKVNGGKVNEGRVNEGKIDEIKINLEEKGVTVMVCSNTYHNADNIFNNYVKQNVQKKELIILVRNDKEDFEKWVSLANQFPMSRVYEFDENKTTEECLKYGMEQSIFDYTAILEEDKQYESDYLSFFISNLDKSSPDK